MKTGSALFQTGDGVPGGQRRTLKMEAYKQQFIEFMIDCNVLKFGDFVTKSGRKTPFLDRKSVV